jgi:hypothetical protein
MKAWLGIRDSDAVYLPERTDGEGTIFGIDAAEKVFLRVREPPAANP